MEPYRLRSWRVTSGRLFTCGRPGRARFKDSAQVPEKVVHQWVEKLPGPGTVIVSLLGKKKNGTSEFSFYPFRGGFDEVSRKPSFEQWLRDNHAGQGLSVHEHPTIDYEPVPADT